MNGVCDEMFQLPQQLPHFAVLTLRRPHLAASAIRIFRLRYRGPLPV